MINRPLYLLLVLLLLSCSDEEPAPADRFWEERPPSELGINENELNTALEAATDEGQFYAVLVIRHGYIAGERYYRGKGAGDLLHLRSITKNVTSALYGIARADGYIGPPETLLSNATEEPLPPAYEAISLHHLLNMTAGIRWDEDTEVLDLIEHRIPDPIGDLLQRPLIDTPGTAFGYNSALPHLISDLISTESNLAYEQYAEESLFSPLGIDRYAWTREPGGAVWGGFGLQLRARDLARFGLLYLDGGLWQNTPLLDNARVQESFTIQVPLGTSGSSGYSYYWWLAEVDGHLVVYGQGYGGQGLMLVPDMDLMVIGLQEHLVSAGQSRAQWRAFIDKVFLPVLAATG